jgi:SnoaL-like domain
MGLDPERARAFVDGYRETWESWNIEGFVELFSDDVVYIDAPIQETVVGSEALTRYVRKEQAEQDRVSVRTGRPVVEGDRVVGEFWVTPLDADEEGSFAGCFIARLDETGRCTNFREYYYDITGDTNPYAGWGE